MYTYMKSLPWYPMARCKLKYVI